MVGQAAELSALLDAFDAAMLLKKWFINIVLTLYSYSHVYGSETTLQFVYLRKENDEKW